MGCFMKPGSGNAISSDNYSQGSPHSVASFEREKQFKSEKRFFSPVSILWIWIWNLFHHKTDESASLR